MKHIDEMNQAIQKAFMLNEHLGEAAFDALMDAVPDLVWHDAVDDPGYKYAYGIDDLHYGVREVSGRGIYFIHGDVVMSHPQDTDQESIDAVNAHHREQVRKIWTTTSTKGELPT